MEWTEPHALLLCHEILHDEPYQSKKGSTERGEAWTQIAKRLSGSDELIFRVDQRGVRESMERLKTNYKAKMKEEESASEITVEEISELYALICLIIKQERMAEEARQANVNWKKMLTRQQRRCEMLRRSVMEKQGKDQKRKTTQTTKSREGKWWRCCWVSKGESTNGKGASLGGKWNIKKRNRNKRLQGKI